MRVGSPEEGKAKHEYIEYEVLALVEEGDFVGAERSLARFHERYGGAYENVTAFCEEYVRWRRGETPHPERLTLIWNDTDLHRYWMLEFRNAAGEKAAAIQASVEEIVADGHKPAGALMALHAAHLWRLHYEQEAIVEVRKAGQAADNEAKGDVVARSALKLVSGRLRQITARF